GPLQSQRGRGGRRLEADREEDDLPVRILLGEAQSVEGRVDHPDVGALGLDLSEGLLGARDPHHVAEAGEDHVVLGGHRDSVVDPAHRNHAYRATRPVDELHVLREQVVQAVLVDRVRVPPADLHDLVVAAGLDRLEDLLGERLAEVGVPELVDEPHAHAGTSLSTRAIAVPACTSRRSPSVTGATSAISTELRRPSSSAEHRASSTPSSTRTTSIFTASSPQVMHPVTWSQWGFRPSLIDLVSSLRTRGEAAGGRRW